MTQYESSPHRDSSDPSARTGDLAHDLELERVREQIEQRLLTLSTVVERVDYSCDYDISDESGNVAAELQVQTDTKGGRGVHMFVIGQDDSSTELFRLSHQEGCEPRLRFESHRTLSQFQIGDDTSYPDGFVEFVRFLEQQTRSEDDGEHEVQIDDDTFERLYRACKSGAEKIAPTMYSLFEEYISPRGFLSVIVNSDMPVDEQFLPVEAKEYQFIQVRDGSYEYIYKVHDGSVVDELDHDSQTQAVSAEQLRRVLQTIDEAIEAATLERLAAFVETDEQVYSKVERAMAQHPGAFQFLTPDGQIDSEKILRIVRESFGPDASVGERNKATMDLQVLADYEAEFFARLEELSNREVSDYEMVMSVGEALTGFDGRQSLVDLINELLAEEPLPKSEYLMAALRFLERKNFDKIVVGRVTSALLNVATVYGTSPEKITEQFTERCIGGELRFDAKDEDIYQAFGTSTDAILHEMYT